MSETKKSLREAVQSRLMAQSPVDRSKRSAAIEKKLWSLPEFQKAKLVFFFVSMAEEVETHGMIDRLLAEGRRVAVPRADLKTKQLIFYEISDAQKQLKPGVYGILEPNPVLAKEVAAREAGCVIVPGVVFDKKKRRIGHGAGFYDRFLGQMDAKIPKVGLAYSFQVMIHEVQQESHDVALDEVITD